MYVYGGLTPPRAHPLRSPTTPRLTPLSSFLLRPSFPASFQVTIPGSKEAYRLIGEDGQPILDLLIRKGEAPPIPGRRMMCRHPFNERQRAWVTAAEVLPLHTLVWDGSTAAPAASVTDTRQYVKDQLNMLRQVRRTEKERERAREREAATCMY